ncbi:c-type cytochrome [Flavobacterium sp. CYK-55]|uniref:c-type cytochrome n=1 Tax=Flavobacterium sp. CYK-55 TaxID=2835529 RepID=UPI0020C15E83|nr:c-type cytochrome [Flavobacterium sp. CYK-55]
MMRTAIYISLTAAIVFLVACNTKKEEQDFGKKQPEAAATAQTPAEKGQEIFEGKGTCTTCHKPDEKVVGPSLKDIATIYKQKGLSVAAFINEESKPVVDPALYETMKANFAITKMMTPEERQNIEAYIMSFAK